MLWLQILHPRFHDIADLHCLNQKAEAGWVVQGKVVKRKSRFATEAGADEDGDDDESPGGEFLERTL